MQHYGPDHIEVARTLTSLAATYAMLGDAEKQRKLLERVLALEERFYGSDHENVARTLVSLALAQGSLGNNGVKRNLLERALRIQKMVGPMHSRIVRTFVKRLAKEK